MRVRNDAELRAHLYDTLYGHDADADLHVFACGSLLWVSAMGVASVSSARVHAS